MRRIIDFIKDLLKSIWISIISIFLVMVLTTGAGFFRLNGDVKALLLLDQRALLIVASLGLFVVAGLLLKRHSTHKLVNESNWKKHFRYFNFVGVLAVIFFDFILVAGAIDYWLQR